ncbi:glycosyltransferase family A protein [Microlunatus ginsengisoli]|uniref:Uncharacterized protein n=1 Tax=Microlunatus ginsengisoli TaxID=363863 RepID=A0ABP6ZWH0_9ACTN
MKVSVIVPVCDPGEHLRRCLQSLAEQTMNLADYEVVLVDDGSTDGSSARLDRTAERHPQFRVIHQPNSGGPGQPRNRGIEEARGDYVFFCDHDDWLAPYALEVLHRFAVENGSDIVLGKMAGIGRPVPRVVFDQTRPVATLADTPLMDSLNVYKLFRREFLRVHDLRFAEGRRRLEDHLFVTEAYLHAGVISIYADQVCYFHARWPSSASAQPPHWGSYFTSLEEAVGVVERRTEPGPFRDRLLTRWLRVEMVNRLTGQNLLTRRPHDAAALFDAAQRVAAAHFGDGVVARLDPIDRPVGRAVVAGTLAEVWERAAAIDRWRVDAEVLQAGWRAGTLQLSGMISLNDRDARADGDSIARLRILLSDVDSQNFNDVLIRATPTLELISPTTGERFTLLAGIHGDGLTRSFTIDIDPATLPVGDVEDKDVWTFRAHFMVLGLGGSTGLRMVDERPLSAPIRPTTQSNRGAELIGSSDTRQLQLRLWPVGHNRRPGAKVHPSGKGSLAGLASHRRT